MITRKKIKAFNDLQNTHEYATHSIKRIYQKSGLTGEEGGIIGDLLQNTVMIINGVSSKNFNERTFAMLNKTCNEEVKELFMDAIQEKDITIITNYPKKGKSRKFTFLSFLKNILKKDQRIS